jgi:hypothetical protein
MPSCWRGREGGREREGGRGREGELHKKWREMAMQAGAIHWRSIEIEKKRENRANETCRESQSFQLQGAVLATGAVTEMRACGDGKRERMKNDGWWMNYGG